MYNLYLLERVKEERQYLKKVVIQLKRIHGMIHYRVVALHPDDSDCNINKTFYSFSKYEKQIREGYKFTKTTKRELNFRVLTGELKLVI